MNDRDQQLALPGPLERPGQAEADQASDQNQEEAVAGVRELAKLEAPEQAIRLGDEVGVDAPDELGDVLQNE